jgi:hypothetical protein
MPQTAIAPGRSNAQQSGQCEGRKGQACIDEREPEVSELLKHRVLALRFHRIAVRRAPHAHTNRRRLFRGSRQLREVRQENRLDLG